MINQESLFNNFRSPHKSLNYYWTPSTTQSYGSDKHSFDQKDQPFVQQFSFDPDVVCLNKMMSGSTIEEKQNQRHKTDRFIPIRKAMSMEAPSMDIQFPDQNQQSLRGKQMNESKLTLDQIYKAVLLQNHNDKVLTFGDSALRSNNILNTLENNRNIAITSGKQLLQNNRIQKKYLNNDIRKIAKTPFKVLDAPNLQDDFYLNLLQWSSQNILSVALQSSLYFWNANNNRVTRFCDLNPHSISSINWNDNGTHISIGTSKGTIQVWDAEKSTKIFDLAGHSQRVSSLAWRGNMIATGSRDRTINVRDIRQNQRQIINTYDGHTQQVCGLKWSFDGNLLASGGNDNKLMIWSSHSNVPISKFSHHCAAVKGLAWSPHNHGVLASGGGSADKTIKFWNTLNGALLDSIDTGSQVCNLMFSKTTKQIVSTHGYSNNQIIVWKYPSLQKVCTLTGHTSRVLFLAMNPSGQTIVTGAGDQTLRFWNVFPTAQKKCKKATSLNTMQLR